MLVFNITKKEVCELPKIEGLEVLLGMADVDCACNEGKNLGCEFEMTQDDYIAWKDVLGNAANYEDAFDNCICAGWNF